VRLKVRSTTKLELLPALKVGLSQLFTPAYIYPTFPDAGLIQLRLDDFPSNLHI
ncbi:hypothetical protein GQ44DRAFT_579491, partial [Phaeosphaeriaceae sp. PMI808]